MRGDWQAGPPLSPPEICANITGHHPTKKKTSKRLPGTLAKLAHEAPVPERSLTQLGLGCAQAPSCEQGPVHACDGVCLCVCVCTYINQVRPPYLSLLRSSKICQNFFVTPGSTSSSSCMQNKYEIWRQSSQSACGTASRISALKPLTP